MWNLVKDLLLLSLGAGIGIVTMAVIQVGSMADKQIENMEKERNVKK